MSTAEAIDIFKQALWMSFQLSAPLLTFGLVAGLSVSIFQAVTQIHEATLSFVPKVAASMVALVIFLPWMMQTLIAFTTRLFIRAASLN